MIYVITHKVFDDKNFCKDGYKVLHVGTNDNMKLYYLRDDVGDNIAKKNPYFCELTGMYWIWKNSEENPEDIVGLVHYRRGFTSKRENLSYSFGGNVPQNIEFRQAEMLLKGYDMIVPIPEKGFKTVCQTYAKMHHGEDLILTREAIAEACPEYLNAFDQAMKEHYYFNGNMFITQKKNFDAYASWLFSIYDRLEKKIDLSKYEDTYQARVYGFISERLLNVWLLHNKVNYKELPVFNTEIRSMNVLTKNIGRVEKIFKR
ncbi:DUF4422 domain-containing protein [Blautia marasmi]|uniref:DUF4422 domain-containing protein n=1 Tax=Blautia marasmi TaxID=1917868 RepID=UPI000CF228F1|nr:DUF4422 domain-containing protein [Blautia marasmi]